MRISRSPHLLFLSGRGPGREILLLAPRRVPYSVDSTYVNPRRNRRPPSLLVDALVAKQPRVGFSASSNSSFIDANVTHRARPPMQALERRSQRDRTPAPPTQRSAADVTQLFSHRQEKFSSSTLVAVQTDPSDYDSRRLESETTRTSRDVLKRLYDAASWFNRSIKLLTRHRVNG